MGGGGHHGPSPSPPPSAACTAACNATCGADKADPSKCGACVQAHSAQLELACGGGQKQLQAAAEALCYGGGGGGGMSIFKYISPLASVRSPPRPPRALPPQLRSSIESIHLNPGESEHPLTASV